MNTTRRVPYNRILSIQIDKYKIGTTNMPGKLIRPQGLYVEFLVEIEFEFSE